MNGDLIAYAKYRIDDVLQEVLHTFCNQSEQPKGKFHVLMTIYLPRCIISTHEKAPRSSCIAFLGRDWICGHIDEFFPVYDLSVGPVSLSTSDTPLSQLFQMLYFKELSSISSPTPMPHVTSRTTPSYEQRTTRHPKLNFLIQSAISKANQGISSERMQELNDILCNMLSRFHPCYEG